MTDIEDILPLFNGLSGIHLFRTGCDSEHLFAGTKAMSFSIPSAALHPLDHDRIFHKSHDADSKWLYSTPTTDSAKGGQWRKPPKPSLPQQTHIICPECQGTLHTATPCFLCEEHPTDSCPVCNGSSIVIDPDSECYTCSGHGRITLTLPTVLVRLTSNYRGRPFITTNTLLAPVYETFGRNWEYRTSGGCCPLIIRALYHKVIIRIYSLEIAAPELIKHPAAKAFA